MTRCRQKVHNGQLCQRQSLPKSKFCWQHGSSRQSGGADLGQVVQLLGPLQRGYSEDVVNQLFTAYPQLQDTEFFDRSLDLISNLNAVLNILGPLAQSMGPAAMAAAAPRAAPRIGRHWR